MSTFSVYVGARKVYLHKDSTKSKYGAYTFWIGYEDFNEYKKHPTLKAARSWVPENRTDDEWETVIHEFDEAGKLVATHPIK